MQQNETDATRHFNTHPNLQGSVEQQQTCQSCSAQPCRTRETMEHPIFKLRQNCGGPCYEACLKAIRAGSNMHVTIHRQTDTHTHPTPSCYGLKGLFCSSCQQRIHWPRVTLLSAQHELGELVVCTGRGLAPAGSSWPARVAWQVDVAELCLDSGRQPPQ